MTPKIVRNIILIGIVLLLTACQSPEEATPTIVPLPVETLSPEQTFVLGDVSGNAAWTIEHFGPLADYLAANLSDFGITSGRVVVTSDLESMVELLENGEVDLYFDSPYPALEVYENIGAVPLVRRWKGGVSEYHSVIIALNGGEITELDDLLGKMIAYDHPASTSGYLLPTSYLVTEGYTLTEKDSVDDAVAANEIGYVFAYGEENEASWVIQGKVVAAAFANSDFEDLSPEQQEQLTILTQTPSVPRHVALARPGMDERLQSRIIELLLEIDQTPEGPAILETFERTSKFDALPWGMMESLKILFAPVR